MMKAQRFLPSWLDQYITLLPLERRDVLFYKVGVCVQMDTINLLVYP